MTESPIHSDYRELQQRIREYDRAYYGEARPLVSDAQYDRHFRQLVEWEQLHPEWVSSDSPSQRVGAALPEGSRFERVEHVVPMISIESLFSMDEVEEFHQRVVKGLEDHGIPKTSPPSFVCEPKWDGVSAALIYEDGILVRALSRGDGSVGEDLTHNLRAVSGVPLRLVTEHPPALVEVRGEVMLSLPAFEKLNQRMLEMGNPPFANPRNAASGTLKRLDPGIVAKRGLSFMAWELVRCEGAAAATPTAAPAANAAPAPEQADLFQAVEPAPHAHHSDALKSLREWGFPVSPFQKVTASMEEMKIFHHQLEEQRDQIDFEMDGVVIKLDDLANRKQLGSRARTPRWACAYKFAPREETTQLLGIEIQVGRTGRLTPRAVLEPVQLGGTTVGFATLHNASYISDLDIRIGDRVIVRRAGDVIPQILGPVLDVRTGDEEVFEWPKKCPSCESKVGSKGEHRYCVNMDCPAQMQRRVMHLSSRVALRIEGLGEKAVVQFAEAGLLQKVEDVFQLDYAQILELPRWAKKSVDALREQIEAAKCSPLDKFLFALGIREVGAETARALAITVGSLEELQKLCSEEDVLDRLAKVEGIGKEVAKSIRDFFGEEQNQHALSQMLERGVQPQAMPKNDNQGEQILAGAVFVLTGALSAPRPDLKAQLEAAGAKVVGSISKKTNFLVAGENAGSKLAKAEKFGVEVLDEAGMRELLKGSRQFPADD